MEVVGVSKAQAILAQKLKHARLNANLSQTAVGVAIGLDESGAATRISRYESGKYAIPLHMIERLSSFYNVPLCWLFSNEPDLDQIILDYFRKMTLSGMNLF
jgi:transcriptional regulator with XRE-family HTH domain